MYWHRVLSIHLLATWYGASTETVEPKSSVWEVAGTCNLELQNTNTCNRKQETNKTRNSYEMISIEIAINMQIEHGQKNMWLAGLSPEFSSLKSACDGPRILNMSLYIQLLIMSLNQIFGTF